MRKIAFLSLLVGAATATPSPRANHVLHEKRAFEPEEWVQSGRLDPGQILPLRIGLAQSNLDRLEDMLMAVSHPTSPDYGKHLTPEQVIDTFAPSRSSVDTVKDWLTSFGFSEDRIKLSPSKVWMDVVNATASEVEDLLNTEYHVYTHSETGLEQISCHSYYVPNHVKDHIELIKPTVHFKRTVSGTAKPRHKRQAGKKPLVHSHLRGPMPLGSDVTITPALENCDETITVACLQALYSVNYTPVATDRNTYGIVEFTPVAFLQGDLDLFFGNFSPNLVGVSPNLVSIDGGVDQTQQQGFDDNGEADLDLEYAMALTNPQPITLLQTGDLVEGKISMFFATVVLYANYNKSTGASFDNWLDAVDGSFCTFEGGDNPEFDGIYPDPAPGGFEGPESCGILAPPNVVSVSFGSDEADVSLSYATRQCNEYGKLGLMGSSVLYSSGDDGVAGNGDLCLNARNRPVRNGTKFNPGFPVTCPFVTAVGATQIDPGNTVNDPEGACEQVIFSGGGFSNFFAMPSYQADAVTNFLTNHPPPFTSAQFNNSGNVRAFPDLSANGANYVIGVDGEFELVFGTSCSSPVVGSFLTLINDARIAAGKGPVGFINPTIYSAEFASAFNDITHGGNQGCGTPGFTATTGWDPVTGVGTPNVTRLMELWLTLP